MKFYRAVFLLMAISARFSYGFENQFEIDGGYKNPHGLGVEYSMSNESSLGILLGAGIWMDGIRLSLGTRKYFLSERRLNPLVEIVAYYNTGTPWIRGTFNGEKGDFRFGRGAGLNVGGGIRWKILKNLGPQWALGYQEKILEPKLETKSLVGAGRKGLTDLQASGVYLDAGLFVSF